MKRHAAIFSLFIGLLFGFPGVTTAASIEPNLKRFLQTHLTATEEVNGFGPVKVTVADPVSISKGRTLIVVYVFGGGYCGSGGCHTVVLEKLGQQFRIIGEIGVSHKPVRLLATSSHGYPDLGVQVRGGGLWPGYEARLRYNGKNYPSNPTRVPAEPAKSGADGKILLGETDEGEPLFP